MITVDQLAEQLDEMTQTQRLANAKEQAFNAAVLNYMVQEKAGPFDKFDPATLKIVKQGDQK